jgi:hypothetical protein
MMTRTENGLVLNSKAVRNYIVPSAAEMASFNLKPYVAPNTPKPDTKPPTEMEYLKLLEEQWSPATKQVFEKMAALKLVDASQKIPYRGKWGY